MRLLLTLLPTALAAPAAQWFGSSNAPASQPVTWGPQPAAAAGPAKPSGPPTIKPSAPGSFRACAPALGCYEKQPDGTIILEGAMGTYQSGPSGTVLQGRPGTVAFGPGGTSITPGAPKGGEREKGSGGWEVGTVKEPEETWNWRQ